MLARLRRLMGLHAGALYNGCNLHQQLQKPSWFPQELFIQNLVWQYCASSQFHFCDDSAHHACVDTVWSVQKLLWLAMLSNASRVHYHNVVGIV